MTQCSMLHVQGARLDLQRAADVMSLLTTTSPNYLLMASLDAARAQVQRRLYRLLPSCADCVPPIAACV